MTANPSIRQGSLFRAAASTLDLNNPAQALNGLLRLASQLLSAPRAALYEYDESENSFSPRFSLGLALSDLGRLSPATEHPVLRTALTGRQAAIASGARESLGLPLAPGNIVCAPCLTSGQTIGLLFVANDAATGFDAEAAATAEIIASRAAEVLAFARQSAGQSYLFHKLSLLYQATHAITGTRDPQEAVRQTAAHLLKATSADSCEVLVFGEGTGMTTRFRPQLGKSVQHTVVSMVTEAMPEYPVHKQVLRDLKPATLSLVPPQGSPRDMNMLQEEGLAAACILPLATQNQALGLVRLLYTQPGRQVNEQEMELAQAILNVGAAGLQDAVHLETAKARADQLQLLGDIGRDLTSTLELEVALENAMQNAQRLLGVEACVLFLLDEPGENLTLKASGGTSLRIRDVSIRLEEGIAGWVARNRQPLIANDVRANPLYHSSIDGQTGLLTTSVLCVPMETRGQMLGVIEAINHPRGAFIEADQQMLTSVASWAAVAIENANLFQRVAEERRRLEATLVETADGVVLTDRSGKIILVNKAAAQAFRINADMAAGRMADEIFFGHPLGGLLVGQDVSLPTTMEVTTPTKRELYASVSEVTDVGRVAVMQDITALKQIDRMRSQFLGTAAHDLKNPLNAIRLGADLLNDAPLSEQQRKALNMMQRATDSMTNLITGLLETIRVESNANMSFEPCQVNDLIRRAIEDLRPLAEARKHTIVYEPPREPVLIVGDPSRLNSVMTNLLSNAIKFTDEGGRITIGVDWDEDRVNLHVTDTGPGIPEDEMSRVFEHLFRGRATVRDPNNPVEGTGLGLALAKTVVEQHGGKIWVTNKAGEGATFHVTLQALSVP
ncbi:MAG: GAF domain-containing protein [Chloroflexi bacterium]|nr:GAF domain-containing protein [Chloroflexota bacterium]